MSKTKKAPQSTHTPGPWEAYETPGRWNVCHKSEGHIGGTFAEVRALHMTPEAVAISEANAKLIAAAPDLLAVCKAVLAWGDAECMPMGGKSDCPFEAIEDAIKKAVGK